MKALKRIIYKDFVSVGGFSYICYYIMLFITMILAFWGNLPFFIFFVYFFIYTELPCGALWADDTQGWTKYSGSLMLSRKSIINGRYVYLLIHWLVGITIIELCLTAGHLMRGEQAVDLYNMVILSNSVLILCLNSIAVSLMLFGHKFIAIGFIGVSSGFIVGYFGSEIGKVKNFSMQVLNEVDDEVRFMFEKSFNFELIAVCAVITAVVWIFTLKLYQRKDT